jgi:serine/threonine protein kinase
MDLTEYERRFPGCDEAIDLAVKRIRRLKSNIRFVGDSNTRVAKPTTSRTVNPTDNDLTTGADDLRLRLDLELHTHRDSDDEIPSKFGAYQQIERINSGGFGIVCRAVDSRDQKKVALKFPRRDKFGDRSGLKEYIEEANKAMVLDHPGIVRTFAIEAHDGYLAIVLQYIDGADLKSPVVQPRSQTRIVELVAKIADALAYAHRQGIYHRDLKPGNILVDLEGNPYVADFGLALHECDQLYSPSQRCGTTYYMPPEQVSGLTRRLDGRSDIWSLGVVLYELLTHRKPFDGVTEKDVFDQIENKDPRPPRQIDDSIDREVQRICLKCLERQQRDRYPTADELAEDLRHWLAFAKAQTLLLSQPEPSLGIESSRIIHTPRNTTIAVHSDPIGKAGPLPQSIPDSSVAHFSPFTPRGIRAYTTEDAEFFLELLPGPRNRDGISDSIRFWLVKICEPVAPHQRVPVGVLFGPSGSGKTSFVKAGLLPQLPHGISTIYVEASQAKTEHQLKMGLRTRLPGIPDEVSLPDLFRGLAQGKWLPAGINKLLIVVDQFEQHLSLDGELKNSQLVKALRHCDGKNVQCLLLFRDDFLTRMSRFLDALEVDFREGENAQAIDLFDRKHAQNVLARLGRAYGQLPPEPTELSKQQARFLEQAVDQLVQGDHVICVHLTLFAEMFQHLPWTTEELKKVGGVAGVGEKYLDLAFGPNSRDKRLYRHREAVQALLESLLPAEGSDIRGAIRSESELIKAAGMEQQPQRFADLINSLEGQIRLITRSDPEIVRSLQSEPASHSPSVVHYQLTHDYLVPSIRAWLENGWGLTRAGRAKTHLRKLAKLVVPGQTPPKLPTSLEWLNWQFILPQASLSQPERQVLRAAGLRFTKQLAAILVLTSVAGLLALQGIRARHRQQQIANSNDLITELVQKEVGAVPEIVSRLDQMKRVANPLLENRFKDSQPGSREQVRLAMALLPHDRSHLPLLLQSAIAVDSMPEQVQTIVELIRNYGFQDHAEVKSSYEDVTINPEIRFRALASEIALRQGKADWSKYHGLVLTGLQQQPSSSLEGWLNVLKPAGSQFTEKFQKIWATTDDLSKASVLAKALFAFLDEPVRQDFFLTEIQKANAARFSGLMKGLEENGSAKQMIPAMTSALERSSTDSSRANYSAALFRLGHDQPLIEMFRGGIEDQRSLLAVFASKPDRINAHELMALYDRAGLAEFSEPGLRRSVLQALAHHAPELIDDALRNRLTTIAKHHVGHDPDACCFSTAELILIHLGVGS